jgi:hypothetical protein
MLAQERITVVTGTTETLATFILLLVAGSLVSLIAVHFLDRGVNPLTDAVSDYGAREHAWFYRLTAIWLGFAGLLFAVMLADATFPKPTLTILSLLVFAATRWAITIFPTDLEDEEGTSVGRSHTVLAATAFASIAIAAASFSFSVPSPEMGSTIDVLAVLVVIFAVATGAARVTHARYFGLIERIFYLTMFAWLSAFPLDLLLFSNSTF